MRDEVQLKPNYTVKELAQFFNVKEFKMLEVLKNSFTVDNLKFEDLRFKLEILEVEFEHLQTPVNFLTDGVVKPIGK